MSDGQGRGSLVPRPHLFRLAGLAACSTFLGLDVVSFSENGNDLSDRLIFKLHMTNAPLST